MVVRGVDYPGLNLEEVLRAEGLDQKQWEGSLTPTEMPGLRYITTKLRLAEKEKKDKS